MSARVKARFSPSQPVMFCGAGGNGTHGTILTVRERRSWSSRRDPEYQVRFLEGIRNARESELVPLPTDPSEDGHTKNGPKEEQVRIAASHPPIPASPRDPKPRSIEVDWSRPLQFKVYDYPARPKTSEPASG